MRVFEIKYLFGLIGCLGLSSGAFAQMVDSNNNYSTMQFGNTVGVYATQGGSLAAGSNMQLPAQVGVYQGQGTTTNGTRVNYGGTVVQGMPVRAKRVVNYDLAPTISDNLYNEVKGYQTPNRYTLSGAKRFGNAQRPEGESEADSAARQLNAMMEDYGTEYFLSLSYGFGKFDGKGLSNKDLVFPPVNNEEYKLDNPKVMSAGFGVMSNRQMSISVDYTNLSGLKYGSTSYSNNQWCGFGQDGFYFDCTDENSVRGGGIKSSALMLNVRLPFADVVKGTMFEGLFIPYVSFGAGVAFNTVDDFDVTDQWGNQAELPVENNNGALADDKGALTGYYQENGLVSHFGSTTSGTAYNLEVGVTFNLDRKTMLDVYFKHADFGDVETQDLVYYNYDEYDIIDPIKDSSGAFTCTEAALNDGFEYDEELGYCVSEASTVEGFESGAKEKGKIAYNEIGLKLRMIF